MLAERLAVCALARDCATSLPSNIRRIERLRSEFADSSVVIVENDSTDSTKDILLEWQRSAPNVKVVAFDVGQPTLLRPRPGMRFPATSRYRIERMSYYRNLYLEVLDSMSLAPTVVVMIDVDVPWFSVEGTLRALRNAPPGWGALFANGYKAFGCRNLRLFPVYHDMYAFLAELPAEKPYITSDKLFQEKKRMRSRLGRHEYYPCVSAFGGLAIYQYGAIRGLRYKVENNFDAEMEVLCEHVPFNVEVGARGYGTFVCRSIAVDYGNLEPRIFMRVVVPERLFRFLREAGRAIRAR